MEAKEALLPDDIFKTGRLLEVPFYQRSYVWGEDEWARLLDDLKNMCEAREPYFLGSVILKKTIDCGPGNDDFASKAIVVDGQQRLTTMQLLLKVIALKTGNESFDSRFYFQRETQHSLTKRLYFLHNRNDRADFERAMAAETASPLDGDSNVIKAFNYFVENIDEDRAWSMNYMDLMQFTQFVLITLSEQDDEQQIFDTINSLGMRLTTAELLKNYFFSRENIETYKTHWEDVFERDDETKAYWDQTITTGRLRRSMIDLFFSAFLQLEADKKDDVSEDERRSYEKSERLFQSYRQFIMNHCDGDPSSLIDALKANAETFRGLFDPSARGRMVGPVPGMDRMNVVIFGLQNSTLIPYVLYLREHIADDALFDEMLGILEAYVMRRMVLRADTKNYNRFFSSLIREGVVAPDALRERLSRESESTTDLPSLDKVDAAFRSEGRLNHLQARGILYLLEASLRDDKDCTQLLGFDSYSLEHLMPRKWEEQWPFDGDEQAKRERNDTLKTLGNLAIITQGLNSSVSNAPWDVKKKGREAQGRTRAKPGLESSAAGLRTMERPLAAEVWDETAIAERAEELAAVANEVWAI
ncbi:DUF262 domain-containing protein [Caniella muris]|uniref:DUF262 domain-containing protein n=1 Tax=Caniella muris TaxID=2941502 RepID=UPI00204195C1|nr:DUF262 domain-containing protein [Caniella muris]